MIPDRQFVFIIGAARSGTTWLQAMSAAHPLICSTIDELKLFDFFTARWADGWEYLLRLQKANGGGPPGLTAIWTEAEFYEFLKEFVGRVYTRVLAMNPQAAVLLDKAPAYSNHIEHINKLIPQPKFIHVIRDGRDVAASLLAASRGWGSLWAPKRVESAASVWKSTVIEARKGSQYQGRYLEIRYEELLTKGASILQTVFEFIGVPIDKETAVAIYNAHQFDKMKQEGTGVHDFTLPKEFFRKGTSGDWRNSLNLRERYLFHETAGDLLCSLGYADPLWWCEDPYQRFTVPLLTTLSSRQRMQVKTIRKIKRALGPRWTNRIRLVRAQLKQKTI
jgi:hypothetical protein